MGEIKDTKYMKDIAKFLFEVGMLKCLKHVGWWKEGVKDPESVADHNCRTAVLGYILAKLEYADVDKVVKMCVFHDIAETRIGDMDKLAKKYIDKKESEKKAFADQVKTLPENMKVDLSSIFMEFEEGKTKEAVVARDADILEVLIQAKEY